jgi:ribosomal-protein-alanine N-acetyltransferase
MTQKDLPEVLAIERVSFPNPWHETTFEGEIQNEGISFPLVAVHRTDKKIIGYILFWKIKDEILINNIAVHGDFRRRGVAEAMMQDVLAIAHREGVVFASLEVRSSNKPARTFYEKLGFRLIGIRKDYYSNPKEDALALGLNLAS